MSGKYIRGPTRKAGLLESHGAKLLGSSPPKSLSEIPAGKALVVLADSGPFDACAWMFDDDELKHWNDPDDYRLKSYWLLDTSTVMMLVK